MAKAQAMPYLTFIETEAASHAWSNHEKRA